MYVLPFGRGCIRLYVMVNKLGIEGKTSKP